MTSWWCTVCSEEQTGDSFIITAPWGEAQEVCTLACLGQVLDMWTEAEADGRLPQAAV